jgi:AraC-like DNA-binding protein
VNDGTKAYVVSDAIGEAAWTKTALAGRSEELTALYAIRHRGRFTDRIATYHDHWEVIAVRAGTCTLTGLTTDLCEHTICLVPPGVPHQEKSERVLDLIWLGVRGRMLRGLDRTAIRSVVSREISDLVENMWMFAQMTPGGIGPELDAMAALVVTRFLRLQAGEAAPSTDRIERAILLFHERMAEEVSMVEVARKLGCSVSCFTREFRRRTGQTPVAYLTGIRVRHAARLLETTGLAVREIAMLTGYGDAFYFSRVFRRVMRKSPAQWRDGVNAGKFNG